MLIALSGTPGTGKTTAANLLKQRGFSVMDVSTLAKKEGCTGALDSNRGSVEVDTDCLAGIDLRKYGENTVFVGHLSHFLKTDIVIILRASPAVLNDRLASRGWSQEKVRENMEAEACDVILIEAAQSGSRVYEIDTTEKEPEEVASDIEKILDGQAEEYLPGKTDWSEEVLSWY